MTLSSNILSMTMVALPNQFKISTKQTANFQKMKLEKNKNYTIPVLVEKYGNHYWEKSYLQMIQKIRVKSTKKNVLFWASLYTNNQPFSCNYMLDTATCMIKQKRS